MPRYRFTWEAHVHQDGEVEADNEEEARALAEEEFNPRRVVELYDFEIIRWEEVDGS